MKAQRATVHPDDAVKAMGYQGPSGASRSRLGALRQYGLLEDAKGGVKLTDLALTILHPANEEELQGALATAAITPPLFKELWDSHKNADASVISAFLIRNKAFSQAGAAQAAAAFRDNVALVKAPPQGYSSPNDESKKDNPPMIEPQGGARAQATRSVQVPLSATTWATVQAPFPITEAAWNQMLAVLNAMKPGLVASGDRSTANDPEEALRRSMPDADHYRKQRPE